MVQLITPTNGVITTHSANIYRTVQYTCTYLVMLTSKQLLLKQYLLKMSLKETSYFTEKEFNLADIKFSV